MYVRIHGFFQIATWLHSLGGVAFSRDTMSRYSAAQVILIVDAGVVYVHYFTRGRRTQGAGCWNFATSPIHPPTFAQERIQCTGEETKQSRGRFICTTVHSKLCTVQYIVLGLDLSNSLITTCDEN